MNNTSALQANIHLIPSHAALQHSGSSINSNDLQVPDLSPDTDITHVQQHLEQSHTMLPLTPEESMLFMRALRQQVQQQQQLLVRQRLQLAQQQQLLVQQQLQITQQQQQIQLLQQQQTTQNNVVSLQSPPFSRPHTLPQQLGLLNAIGEPECMWSTSAPRGAADDRSSIHSRAFMEIVSERKVIVLNKTPIDHSLEEPHGQQGSPSSNEDLESTTSERGDEKTSSATKAKRNRTPLQIQRRLEIIAHWEAREGKSMAELSKSLGIARSTLYGIINNRDELRNPSHSGPALERYRVPGLRSRISGES